MEAASPYMDVVRRVWGYSGLRPRQAEAMRAFLARRDSLVVLPTGSGKSLCFQAPALVRPDELTLVVSPLIALMRDQVERLRSLGVGACFINSAMSETERRETFHRLNRREVPLVYVSPERLAQDRFITYLRSLGVRNLVVDEAHCISHWGHSFRPEYRQLSALRDLFPEAAIHAYTATATPRVRDDIVTQLNMRDAEVIVGDFDRPNLTYRVRFQDKIKLQIREALCQHKNETGIIYCLSRKEVDKLAAELRRDGFDAWAYHAGMDPEGRRHAEQMFRDRPHPIVVATVAFGMGIDRGDVRFVIHAGMPKSPEQYQQEAGRAGRDGEPAECVLIGSKADEMQWERMLDQESNGDPAVNQTAREQLRLMSAYLRSTRCRHNVLVEHFGQKPERETCSACDLCLGEIVLRPDSRELALKILAAARDLAGRFGAATVAKVAKGQRGGAVAARNLDRTPSFGNLSDHSLRQITLWVEQLVDQGVLKSSGGEYPCVSEGRYAGALERGGLVTRLTSLEGGRALAVASAEPAARRTMGSEQRYDLMLAEFQKGRALQVVAASSGVTLPTATRYLCAAVERGDVDTVLPWVDAKEIDRVEKAMAQWTDTKLRTLRDLVGNDVSYEEIHVARAWLSREASGN